MRECDEYEITVSKLLNVVHRSTERVKIRVIADADMFSDKCHEFYLTENFTSRDEMDRVYDERGCSPTITVVSGGGREQKVLTRSGEPICCASRGRNPYNPSDRTAGAPAERIRKLTPRECWRLMGFTDEAFSKAQGVCSNSQLYKQAGNSIVVDVLDYIFKELFTKGKTGGNK